MKVSQERVDEALVYLRNSEETFYPYTKNLDEEYAALIDYLKEQWEFETETQVLEHMELTNINFWSILPEEKHDYYQYFIYYLQLPVEVRNKTIIGRIVSSIKNDVHFSDAPPLKLQSRFMLFWEIRAHLYEENISMALMTTLHDNQTQRIASLRNRSLVLANLSGDVAMELLTGITSSIRTLDYKTLSPNQIATLLSASSKLIDQGNKLAENSLVLSDLVSTLNELDMLSEEERRFIDSETI